VHKAIWDEIANGDFVMPAGKTLTAVSYEAGDDITAYIEPMTVGDEMPNMPLFVAPGEHVLAPLAITYAAVWDVCPPPIRDLLTSAAR
jgi:hypothetical protein